jgi:hypothetical protein
LIICDCDDDDKALGHLAGSRDAAQALHPARALEAGISHDFSQTCLRQSFKLR